MGLRHPRHVPYHLALKLTILKWVAAFLGEEDFTIVSGSLR